MCVYEVMRMKKTTHVSENRVSAAACFNMDGQFYLFIGWCLLQEQIYGRGFNYWRQCSVLRAVGKARAFTVRGQKLWQLYVFIPRNTYSTLGWFFLISHQSSVSSCTDFINVFQKLISLELFNLSVLLLPQSEVSSWNLKVGDSCFLI